MERKTANRIQGFIFDLQVSEMVKEQPTTRQYHILPYNSQSSACVYLGLNAWDFGFRIYCRFNEINQACNEEGSGDTFGTAAPQ